MATRTRKTSTGKTRTSKQRGTSRRSAAAGTDPQLPGISAIEQRKLA